MTIGSNEDVLGITGAGRVVSAALAAMERAIAPGLTTRELDEICESVLASYGATSAPRNEYGFPACSCISLNDEVVHGIPGDRVLEDGDLVTIDVTADCAGYIADAARTVVVGRGLPRDRQLATCSREAFRRAVELVSSGTPLSRIGREIEGHVKDSGFSVIRDLCGHGVGRKVHEPPDVPNYDCPTQWTRLHEGLVLTIEPIITCGVPEVVTARDGWTLKTADGRRSSHYEDTMIVTRGRPIIVTDQCAA